MGFDDPIPSRSQGLSSQSFPFPFHWSSLLYILASNVVLGLGPWSLVVLKDKVSVLGPGLGLEPRVLVNITEIISCC